jgi:hypothetical protein
MSQNIRRINIILKNLLYIHLKEAARHTPYFTLEELNLIGTDCIYTAVRNQIIRSLDKKNIQSNLHQNSSFYSTLVRFYQLKKTSSLPSTCNGTNTEENN